MLTLQVLEAGEETVRQPDEIIWAMHEAWGQWRAHSCVERNGRHSWMMELEMGSPHVWCEWCKTVYQVEYPEEWAMGPIPVNIHFESEHSGAHYDHACDCGWWFVLSPRAA